MSDGDREKAIFAEAVARAWKDSAFHAQLRKSPKEALSALGYKVPDGVELHVVEDTERDRHMALPEAETFDKIREALHTRLDRGLPLPEGVSLKLLQNTKSHKFFVLPVAPPATDELSDEQLANVAGGGTMVNAVAGVDAVGVGTAVVAGEVAVLT
jgi:nitrile hydratase alpha subunit